MTWLKVDIDGEKENLGGYDPEDEWSQDSYSGDAWVESVHLVDKDGYNHWNTVSDVEVGDIVYVVLAVYGTGCSFGSTGGESELFLVTTDKDEAEQKVKYLEKVQDYSVPWNGYFEWLQDIKLTGHIVKGK